MLAFDCNKNTSATDSAYSHQQINSSYKSVFRSHCFVKSHYTLHHISILFFSIALPYHHDKIFFQFKEQSLFCLSTLLSFTILNWHKSVSNSVVHQEPQNLVFHTERCFSLSQYYICLFVCLFDQGFRLCILMYWNSITWFPYWTTL